MNDPDALQALRGQIDAIDSEVLQLVNRRLELARRIGQAKSVLSEPGFYRPEREARIVARLLQENCGLLPASALEALFREIMSAGRATEIGLRVAFLGPAGTYSEAAALKHFGHQVVVQPQPSIDEVFRAVEAGGADFAVVPVENSIEGGVSATMDRLVETPLTVCGEVNLPIRHCLLATQPGLAAIRQVVAHTQSLAQCRRWLAEHLPQAALQAVASNGEAASRAAAGAGVGAIASETAAALYGLAVIESAIEDRPGNTTRFWVLGRLETEPCGADKTSVVLSGQNCPGMLYALLQPLERHDISMTRIESRPSHTGLWEYVFFVDFEGHLSDPAVSAVMGELRSEAGMCKYLGSYPRALT